MANIAILHLEDNPLDAELVVAAIEEGGYSADVLRVQTETEYVSALEQGRFDLVLADYSLPAFDGFAALAALRQRGIDTPFIFISGAIGEDRAIESLKQGATDYVLKHRLDRLLPAVRRALREAAERAERVRAEEERERLLQELAVAYQREHRIAETLQRSFLKRTDSRQFPSLELEPIYQAAWDEALVGGDYFDYFGLQDGRIALVVGDVSGKGLNAAERTAEVKYTLRAYLREHNDPIVAVERLNAFLCEATSLDLQAAEHFVVMALVVLDPSSGTAIVVVAGAEPVLIVRRGGEVDEAKAEGLPLGILPDAHYGSVLCEIGRGDVLLMATDGLTEARQGGRLLGLEGLEDLARQFLSDLPLAVAGRSILRAAQSFAGGKLHDDACLLLARLIGS